MTRRLRSHGRIDARSVGRALLCAAALLVAASATHADVIVLENGRKLTGVIEEQTDEFVVLRRGGGTLRITVDQIKSIERGPAEDAKDPPKPRRGPTWDPRARGARRRPGTEPKPGAAGADRSTAQPTLSQRIAELDKNELAVWEDEPPSPVTETQARDSRYKLVQSGGQKRFQDTLPTTSQAGVKVYKKRKRRGPVRRGEPDREWVRLHWDVARRTWVETPPNRAAFDTETAATSIILLSAAKDHDAAAAAQCQRLAIQMGSELARNPSAALNDERKLLREKARAAVGSDAAAAIYCEAIELGVQIMNAEPKEKIRLCRDRRRTLRRLAVTLGD